MPESERGYRNLSLGGVGKTKRPIRVRRRCSRKRTYDRGGDGERQSEPGPPDTRKDDQCLGGLQRHGSASREGRHQRQHFQNQAAYVRYEGGRGLCSVRFQTRIGEKWGLRI